MQRRLSFGFSKMKKALVVRLGAYGDMVIISPLLKRLKELGYFVILNTSTRGMEVYQHNKYVDELIFHADNSIPDDKLNEHWDEQRNRINPDYYINLCESIEVNIALHPKDKERYDLPKEERIKICNKNYYEETFRIAGIEPVDFRPHIHFSKAQSKAAKSFIKKDKFNVLVALMGSGHNKFFPWTQKIIDKVNGKDWNVITVGDMRSVLVEESFETPIVRLAGKIPMMLSMALTKYVDCVIAPDTGLLHASGCYSTPKIGILGHTTKENITKHFVNDYSIEAEVFCAPCMRLIYDYTAQCPIDPATGAAMCMGSGVHPQLVIDRILEVYRNWKYGNFDNRRRA